MLTCALPHVVIMLLTLGCDSGLQECPRKNAACKDKDPTMRLREIGLKKVSPGGLQRRPWSYVRIGVLVDQIERGSAAETAGLKNGDIIAAVDDALVWPASIEKSDAEGLLRNFARLMSRSGTVKLTVQRIYTPTRQNPTWSSITLTLDLKMP